MALNPEQIKNRLVAVLMPILLAGFLYGIVTGKNVGPTHKQMKIMKAEMKWIMQEHWDLKKDAKKIITSSMK